MVEREERLGALAVAVLEVLLLAQDGEMDAVQLGAFSTFLSGMFARHSMQVMDPVSIAWVSNDKVLPTRASCSKQNECNEVLHRLFCSCRPYT